MKQLKEIKPPVNGDLSSLSPAEKRAQDEDGEARKKSAKNKQLKDGPKIKKNPTPATAINSEEDLPPPVLVANEPTPEEIEMKKMITEAAEQNKKVEIPPDMLKARGYIINEMVDTELKYAWDLNIAIKVSGYSKWSNRHHLFSNPYPFFLSFQYFLSPLREKSVLPLVDVSRIFGNIELVKEASKVLAAHLEQNRAESREYSAIGAIFLSYVKEHSVFCFSFIYLCL